MINSTLETIRLLGIVPVVKLEDADHAVPLGKALIDGGLPCAEITFRTAAAADAIKSMTDAYPDILVGAGTVLTVDQAVAAKEAGAKFIVAPGFNRKVVDYCLENKLPVTPGVVTPTEVELALEYGLEVLKFFPAELAGGLAYLKAISGPYGNVKFIPTGGIHVGNLVEYLRFSKIHACGGSWMVKSSLITAEAFNDITGLVREAVATLLGLSLHHIGAHLSSPEEAKESADALADLLNFNIFEGSASFMLGGQIELMKSRLLDKPGHIAVGTNFIERAVWHFAQQGIETMPGTEIIVDDKLIAVYLNYNVGDLPLHLVQK